MTNQSQVHSSGKCSGNKRRCNSVQSWWILFRVIYSSNTDIPPISFLHWTVIYFNSVQGFPYISNDILGTMFDAKHQSLIYRKQCLWSVIEIYEYSQFREMLSLKSYTAYNLRHWNETLIKNVLIELITLRWSPAKSANQGRIHLNKCIPTATLTTNATHYWVY